MFSSHRISQLLLISYVLVIASLVTWSWVLVDPNFTLLSSHFWSVFREWAVSIGRRNIPFSTWWYIYTIIVLWCLHLVILWKLPDMKNLMIWTVIIGVLAGLISYPAQSHDLFNYIFDAKILTHYHLSPYTMRAMDFPHDPDLRFMRWIHRVYPYGPTFLLLTLVPSFLSWGKFALGFILFKMTYVVLFIVSAWCIQQMDRRAVLVFITSPLVIVEGLVNTHNDFVGVALGIIGFYLIWKKKLWWALLLMIISGLIKYFSVPLIIIPGGMLFAQYTGKRWLLLREDTLTVIAYVLISILIGYVWYSTTEVYSWYFLNLFVFVPYLVRMGRSLIVFTLGLLLCYYPYVSGGGWEHGSESTPRKEIMFWSLGINALLFAGWYGYRRYARSWILNAKN